MATEVKEYDLAIQFGEEPIKEYKLYDGRVVLKYDDSSHTYYIDTEYGRRVVYNATNVLKVIDKSFVLINWAVRCVVQSIEQQLNLARSPGAFVSTSVGELQQVLETARKAHNSKKNDAADIGKLAHNWLEEYGKQRLRGKNHITAIGDAHGYPTNPQAHNCIQAALKWIREHNVQPISVERKVYSEQDDCCGTTDWIGMVDGKLSIIDWKSSTYVYNEHRFQLAFYKNAWEEETGRKIEQRILLRLGKEDGAFEAHVFDNEEQYYADLAAFRAALILHDRIQEIKQEDKAANKKKAAKDQKHKGE